MRDQSYRYFMGSFFSRQAIFAYGIAGGVTTAGQLILIWLGRFSGVPQRTEVVPVIIELYIETLIPLWVPPITSWNVVVLILNLVIALWVLFLWTANYDKSLSAGR